MSQKPSASDELPAVPRWETFVLIASFAAVWVWYLVRQNAGRAGSEPSAWLNLVLLAAIPLLIWILVRRMRRTVAAMRASHPAQRGRRERN